jgi:Cu(I)/Ag(I) efflux system membrane fusion protein
MSNGDIARVQAQIGDSDLPSPDLARPIQRTLWHNSWRVLKTIQARLRFIAILAIVGTAIASWDTLNAYYEKWTRPIFGRDTVSGASTEYACPMHPTLVRDHPDNCPLCGMPLSRRQKAEGALTDEALPPGVVSRVQLTPYRVAAAGIQTSQLECRPLTKEITTVGFVEFDERKLKRITAPTVGKSRIDALYVNVTGQPVQQGQRLALLYSSIPSRALPRERLALWGIDEAQIQQISKSGKPYTQLTLRSPIHGHVIKKYQVEGEYVDEGARLYDVADLSTVWIEAQVYEDDLAFLQPGLLVRASAKSFPNRTFEGKLAFVHPHLDAGTRTLKVRFDLDNPDQDLKPGMYATVTFQVPVSSLPLFSRHAGEKQQRSSGPCPSAP